MKEYVLDAKNQPLGRLASRAAFLLRGKAEANWEPRLAPTCQVKIENAALTKWASRRPEAKKYLRYTGYPGGLKSESLPHLLARRGPAVIIKQAIRGMLPANSHRVQMLKNLSIYE